MLAGGRWDLTAVWLSYDIERALTKNVPGACQLMERRVFPWQSRGAGEGWSGLWETEGFVVLWLPIAAAAGLLQQVGLYIRGAQDPFRVVPRVAMV